MGLLIVASSEDQTLESFVGYSIRDVRQRHEIGASGATQEIVLVTLWFYQDRLHVEYQQTLLARYLYRLERRSTQISSISHPKLYRTSFASPQLELLELDDAQWTKIARRPEYAKRRAALAAAARQLAFDFPLMSWLFCWL